MPAGERLASNGGGLVSGSNTIGGRSASKGDSSSRIFTSSTSGPTRDPSYNRRIDSTPPKTPQNHSARRIKGIKTSQDRGSIRDAFEDPDTLQFSQERSNSNGLSWSPKYARNSVVDNMLLSLDGLEPGTADYETEYHHSARSPETYSSARVGTAGNTTRVRGQISSPANSMDHSTVYDSTPSTHRHRSNNTSLGRIDAGIEAQDKENTTPRKIRHTDGRSSSSESLELERPEPKYRSNRRSRSFDYGHTRMALKTTLNDPFIYDEEVAVAPSVPVVPRTNASLALRPATVSRNTGPEVRRQGSTRSPIGMFGTPTDSQAMQTPSSQDSYNVETLSKISATPTYGLPIPAKENQRPGFFRRMFGSSSGTTESTPPPKRLTRPPASMRQLPVDETVDVAQLLRKAAQEKPRDPLPLNKKSSFFRRRQKSIQEASAPQLPELHRDAEDVHDRAYPDSPGSLQKVMDQYYETHRRMESRGSIAASRRKTNLPSANIAATIRAVPSSAANSVMETPLSRTSIDASSKTLDTQLHRRSTSEGTKLEALEKNRSNDKNKQSPVHTRTQSDIDKDLPRLPINYTAIKDDAPKEVPTSKYNQSSSKPASRGSITSTSHSAARARSTSRSRLNDALRTTPEPVIATDTKTIPERRSSKATETEAHAEDNDDLADETREALMLSVQDVDAITEEQRAQAQKLFEGNSDIERSEIAPWLGEADEMRAKVRQAYMELFDWKGMSILGAMRSFCNHLQLKGETQQVDRLLDALSRRWCDCNPKHGFKATDVVHTICYSIILLNTDLHMADIESKMTRNQFIKNTMPTIRRVVTDAAPNAFNNARASILPPPRRHTELAPNTGDLTSDTASALDSRPTHRLQQRPSDHSGNDTVSDYDDCGPLVKNAYSGKITGWESLIEIVLKNFYNSIRNQRLPLSGTDEEARHGAYSSQSLSANSGGLLRRTNSLLSKAGSETMPVRGRFSDNRTGSRWSSKGRSRPRLYPASLAQSRTSLDDGESAISPSMSSMWSKHSLGKTTMSVASLASAFPGAEYQRSIGFANALSQAITRDESLDNESTQEEFLKVGPLLEDESLELEGAPWAKEGILKHKHHLDAVGKRAKDRNWNECFAVIEKGWIRLFQFNVNAKSMRLRSQKIAGSVVGGGNWMENAQSLGQFLLRHVIASTLPPPGYSKARPHVWALSLPTGAVHLFQAGTPEIVKEFVSTANYWSARLSKEPLTGGVSNIEYGWSDRVINVALLDGSRPPSQAQTATRPSMSQSIRQSFEAGSVSSGRAKLHGDKVMLADWTPPTQSMMASQLLEVDQLRALETYVRNIKEELSKHNELRGAMLLAFTPRQTNHVRAMNNWERKSSYLLREIVKFSTYLESLQWAQGEGERVKKERKERQDEKMASTAAQVEDADIHELAGSTPLFEGKEVVVGNAP